MVWSTQPKASIRSCRESTGTSFSSGTLGRRLMASGGDGDAGDAVQWLPQVLPYREMCVRSAISRAAFSGATHYEAIAGRTATGPDETQGHTTTRVGSGR